MKLIQVIIEVAFGFGLFLATTVPAYPHGGDLDDDGTAAGILHQGRQVVAERM